jgi:hypothetical protein
MDKVKIWYPATKKMGHPPEVMPEGFAHIWHSGMLLCRKIIPDAIKEQKAQIGVIRQGVIIGHGMCPECERIYRTSDEFKFKQWVRSVLGEEQNECKHTDDGTPSVGDTAGKMEF